MEKSKLCAAAASSFCTAAHFSAQKESVGGAV